MSSKDDLFEIEQGFWTGDADYYRQHLDEKCLVAFTEMAGVMGKADIANMIKQDEQRWRDLAMNDRSLIDLTDDVAIICYKASATRGNGDAYNAVVSSGYVRRGGAWKMALHQQTPLPDKKSE